MRPIALKLSRWFDHNARDLPWRRTHDPYAIWISEIMLQQTQVKTVIPFFQRWMRALPTIEAFARARSPAALKLWEGLGYYTRVRNAHAAARCIMREHAGRFPRDFASVLALPGVGRYTAGAICSIAFNQPAPILDGNIIRVLSRVLGLSGNPRDKAVNARLWNAAQQLVSLRGIQPAKLNQAMMELGALVCLPRQPNCPLCPLRRDCFACRENRVAEFPSLAPSAPPTRRHFIALLVRRRDRFLVRRRPPGGVNAGLWEFPNIEVPPGTCNPSTLAAPFHVAPGEPFLRVRHSITRHRILLEACDATLSGPAAGHWKTVAQARKLAFASAHRKVLEALGRRG